MTPEDPRAARTREKLRRALLAECAERPLEEVGVAALVRRAGVGRATFYLHYADLEALAVDACADVVREAVEALHAWRGRPDPVSAPPALLAFFADLAPHAGLYRALLSPGGADRSGTSCTATCAPAAWPSAPSRAPRTPRWWPPRSPPPSRGSSPTGCTDCFRARRRKSPTRSGSCWSPFT